MFTSSASAFLSSWISAVYQLFLITIPGTNITFFGASMSCIVTLGVIAILKQFTGLGLSTARVGSRPSQKGGNNKNIKVQANRKNDER